MNNIIELILVFVIIGVIVGVTKKLDRIIKLLEDLVQPLRNKEISEQNKTVWENYKAEREERNKKN